MKLLNVLEDKYKKKKKKTKENEAKLIFKAIKINTENNLTITMID